MVRALLLFLFITTASWVSAQSSNHSSSQDMNGFNVEILKVFPNPAIEYFQITESASAKKIAIYTMFGREVKSFYYYPDSQYNISDLKSGMYIVKIMDDKNKVLKAIKLQKNFVGA